MDKPKAEAEAEKRGEAAPGGHSCIGSSFEDWLKEEGLFEECEAEARRRVEEWRVVSRLPEAVRPGRLLRGARVRKGLSREELAQAVGVQPGDIEDFEENRRPVSRELAELLAGVLETVPEYFLSRVSTSQSAE